MFDEAKCYRKVQQARHAVCSFLEAHSDSPDHCNKDSASTEAVANTDTPHRLCKQVGFVAKRGLRLCPCPLSEFV